MQHRIPCECGDSVTVAEAAAGSRISCRCGRAIVVPSLRELRRLSDDLDAGPSPELVVETLVLAGSLPEEDHCVLCGVATDRSVYCRTECERAYVKTGEQPWWFWLLAIFTFGLLGAAVVAASSEGKEQEWGKDRVFSLPLRVCDAYRLQLTSPEAVKDALRRVPLYRRLLWKYPGTRVSLIAQ